MIMWFQKISIPHHGGNWKFQRSGGVKENTIPPPQRELEIPKERGVKVNTIPPPQRELEIPKERGGQRKYHTPTTEGIGNSEGEWGRESKTQEIPEGGGGGCMIDFVSGGPLIQYGFECQSSCSKTLSLLSRSFTQTIVA